MAEKGESEINRADNTEHTEATSNLEGFITSQMQQQEKISKESDNLDTTKRDNFIARALSESRRMSMEVEKSREKTECLHAELGERIITQWRNEHSAEVLQAPETNLTNVSFQHG